ncbi:8-amino-7-oxononanoate synthase [Candidatus Thiosymbion oneisti]|uniref:8-amino-7-oxononanoate synthase n=1 Tax=Candidatus Thiosymbion oneisti TaxID=589554 RepID=UPI000B0C5F15|nr:8-amino-7-oxononanoate synthase [Candidatus Thiosymbion oneisti]
MIPARTNLAGELDRLREAHLYRAPRTLASPQGPRPLIDGRRMLAFCSNDYLGLANHPQVIAALKQGADAYGVGSGAAHLVTGHSVAHQALEEELADFTGRARALLFSSGYLANLGVISALTGRGDQVFEDRLNHASLLDGARLSRARLRRYAHADPRALSRMLDALMLNETGARLIATDGVFSMDGDLAPLPELVPIARRADAWLLVDDAHGLGVLGEKGRGSLDHLGLGPEQVPVLVGTLGKALGTAGAFVAGSRELIETLIQRARSYIFTTAPPPAIAVATRESLRIARRESWRRERLRTLIRRFRAGAAELDLPLLDSATPIQPLIAGTARQALSWSKRLETLGILVSAIRPPTVPEGSARLRITFSAAHTAEDVDRLLAALGSLRY